MSERSRILILGARGRLGGALHRCYAAQHDVSAWGREELDLLKTDQISDRLAQVSFDVLINAAGLTHVDRCETAREEAHLSNEVAPGEMARFCAQRGKRFIHISSDYVFSGSGHRPLVEDDEAAPINFYGQSKRGGEIAVLRENSRALVARVSWLFGRDKAGFPDMILRRARQEAEVSAVNDKWSSPTYADDLAEWLELLFTRHADATGLLHLCNAGEAQWQEYGQATLDLARERGIALRTTQVRGHSMQGFEPFDAPRPPYTVLDTGRFTQITGITPRPWQQALAVHLDQTLADAEADAVADADEAAQR
ncbi:MAG: dTDP-4-dehydrorhamnose reductase [Verrucomicrobiales bacterium]|nr:dTDP-4-dehydrorhamnose reductase [Verrucomicrobiales bacterium]